MSRSVFTPPPDKPLRMVGRHDNCYRLHPEVEREKKCLAPVEKEKSKKEKKEKEAPATSLRRNAPFIAG